MTGDIAESVLRVDNLSKKFYLTGNSSEKQSPNGSSNEFYAIKDLSFDIKRGEICGLIGRNGGGKTTLLELLSGIIKPSSGEITIYGKTASVIDIGTGMHRDLSGLENIFLSGEVLGMTKKEIEEKLPEIIAFSELENFLDLPVKHYSSGMFMRLAFSVITHLNADVMLIDEIIGVGDLAFSEKTTARIIEICKQGRSAIIATHSLMLIKACCHTAMYLKNGVMVSKDAVDKIEELYLEDVMDNKSLIPKTNNTPEAIKSFKPKLVYHTDEANGEINLLSAVIRSDQTHGEGFSVRDKLDIELLLDIKVQRSFIISVHINRQYNQPAICLAPELSFTSDIMPGRIKLTTLIASNLLNQGLCTISIVIAELDHTLIICYEHILVFKISIDNDTRYTYGYSGQFSGPLFIGGNWKIEKGGDL